VGDRGFGPRARDPRLELLINFVKTGDPNGAGLPEWPSFRAGSAMKLNTPAACGPEEGRDRHLFLREVTELGS
jgi:carboxylesterase type B